jgi:PhzF family phenazine biosynthesis protein
MTLRIIQIDAFTPRPYAGNPAAVCLLDPPRDAAWLQAVAAEMNLAETAFLWRRDDGFALRWFTPTVEVPLCGHATLASAHALWETATLAAGAVARFHTASGELRAWRDGEWIGLDFPARPPSGAAVPAAVCAALGAEAVATATTQTCHVVELASEAAVRALAPDMRALAAASPAVGVTVTARAGAPPYDIVSRFFAPAHGIDEDPVTGSAHCALGSYWAPRLGKRELLAYQASRRGGTVRVVVEPTPGRVHLFGQAVTVLRGELADAPR